MTCVFSHAPNSKHMESFQLHLLGVRRKKIQTSHVKWIGNTSSNTYTLSNCEMVVLLGFHKENQQFAKQTTAFTAIKRLRHTNVPWGLNLASMFCEVIEERQRIYATGIQDLTSQSSNSDQNWKAGSPLNHSVYPTYPSTHQGFGHCSKNWACLRDKD